MVVTSRERAVAQSAAILQLEGLRASPEVDELLEAWAVGSVDDDALVEAEQRILAGLAAPVAPRAAA
jgi:hypothetical protein